MTTAQIKKYLYSLLHRVSEIEDNGGGGGGSFATITGDPEDNTALAEALAAKADAIDFADLPGDVWDIGTYPFLEKTISANTEITLTGGANGGSMGLLLITNSGTYTLTVDGLLYPVKSNGDTAITVIKKSDGAYSVFSTYTVAEEETTILFQADFDGVNGDDVFSDYTPEVGTLTGGLGAYEIQSNRAQSVFDAVNLSEMIMTHAASDASYKVSAKIKKDSAGFDVWIAVRRHSLDECLIVKVSTTTSKIQTVNSGTPTQIVSESFGINDTSEHLYEVYLTGDYMKLDIDGVTRIPVTDISSDTHTAATSAILIAEGYVEDLIITPL